MRKRRVTFFFFALGVTAGVAVACGARTGLPVTRTVVPDGGDAASIFDVTLDRRPDVVDAHILDALDVHIIEASPGDCPDAEATLVYVITESYDLYSFYPPAAQFKFIGHISCPTADPNTTPFSMGVNRQGIAFIVFNDGNLYRVSTATGACQATSFVPNQGGFTTFGMGYSRNTTDDGETLFVAGDSSNTSAPGLAFIDDAFVLHNIGDFNPVILRGELTGTGGGDLFAFYGNQGGPSFVGQVDKSSASIVGEVTLPGVDQGQGWAFAFWGGDFWLFTAPSGESQVTRYSPSDNSIQVVANLGAIVVGAGVSTCAPQN